MDLFFATVLDHAYIMAKHVFAVCFLSGTQQKFYCVPKAVLVKKRAVTAADGNGIFAVCPDVWHTAKTNSLPCAVVKAHGKRVVSGSATHNADNTLYPNLWSSRFQLNR